MIIQKTAFEGVLIITPKIIKDDRGHFYESYRSDSLEEVVGKPIKFVQENESLSHKNVFRGFHFQRGDSAQSKLVRVISGAVLDIVVDIQTGEYFTIYLNSINKRQIFIPSRYAHGFLSYYDDTILQYKCDKYYDKSMEGGFTFNDEKFKLLNLNNVIVSDKDLSLPKLNDLTL